MSQWLQDVIAHADHNAGAASAHWLNEERANALAKLKKQSWPNRKTEAWRFTSLVPVEKRNSVVAVEPSIAPVVPNIDGLHSIDLVFVGGKLITPLDSLELPPGLRIFALDSEQAKDVINKRFAAIKPDTHLFGLVNDSVANAGVVVDVEEGVKIPTPLRLVHLTSNGVDNHSRSLVNVNPKASLCVIEQGEGVDDSMNTAFVEYDIADNAALEHYRFAMFTQRALHAGGCHFRLGESAYLNSSLVGYGSSLSRLNVDVIYTAPNAKADMNAMYLLAQGENFDLQTTMEHAVPNCTTDEKVRGIVGDRAKANFNGRIHIHRDAQQTLAELNNRNLLLSRRGQINTKPELEIYADDVKCAHGATIAEIEEKPLYYLLSRGISRSQALIMLNFGFIQELINDIKNEAIQAWLTESLRTRFAEMEVK